MSPRMTNWDDIEVWILKKPNTKFVPYVTHYRAGKAGPDFGFSSRQQDALLFISREDAEDIRQEIAEFGEEVKIVKLVARKNA